MTDMRQVKPFPLAEGEAPGPIGAPPTVRWVDPRTLWIEERYQRSVSPRSARLIRRIITGWDWAAFKPPIVAETEDGRLVVIDGQHTAIAASTHPDITNMPVLQVGADTIEARAGSFMRHNRDRVAMTPLNVHHAALAAGDEVAVALDNACHLSGARVLRSPTTQGLKVGDTMAVGGLNRICRDRGQYFTTRLLKILVEAGQAPIDAASIAAVELLLTDKDWKGAFDPAALALTIRSKPIDEWHAYAEIYVRKGMKMSRTKALAIAWFQKVPKKRAAA